MINRLKVARHMMRVHGLRFGEAWKLARFGWNLPSIARLKIMLNK